MTTDSSPRPPDPPALPAWHGLSPVEVADRLDTDPENGLTAAEAAGRLERCGRNKLGEEAARTLPQMILDQFRDVVIWVLIAALVISAALGEGVDAAVIGFIVVLNAVLGVVQEYKAEQSLAALKQLSSPHSRVVRDGAVLDLPSTLLAPGDVVFLEAGNLVPADLRLLKAEGLKIDEAALTGESVPVEKRADAVLDADTPIADRVNMAFSGANIVLGRGRGIVVGTGTSTQVGQIAGMLSAVAREKTPLQERLERLGRQLALLVLAICLIVGLAGWLRGVPLLDLFLTAVSLAVAAIPEGLPAVVTIVLALGVTAMIRRNVIVRRLRSVEALGSTTVICSDKTGTLTQNQMTVRRVWAGGDSVEVTGAGYARHGEFLLENQGLDPLDRPALRRTLEVCLLCNDATLGEAEEEISGDPTEAALLVAAVKAGLSHDAALEAMPRRAEVPFESERKRMSTLHELPPGEGRGFRAAVKGAPEAVLDRCSHLLASEGPRPLTERDAARILEVSHEYAGEALRVLALAYRDFETLPKDLTPDAVERDLVFCGLAGMLDPPREEARESVRVCRRAGIRPVMITGDHASTAAAIARELGIASTQDRVLSGQDLQALTDEELCAEVGRAPVYARVSPSDKLRIVTAFQMHGDIVAMTGDGVNDAPALKKADIGVAMGITGTDVARGAADIVLTDDNFASIVAAVEEGRHVFDNIRKFVFYLLSCNLSEVLAIFLAILAGLPTPLLPVQILWINLVTDGLPALALGVEPPEEGVMARPPQDPREGVLTAATLRNIVRYGSAITLAVLGAFGYGLYQHVLVPAGYVGADALANAFRAEFWAEQRNSVGLAHARTLAFGTLGYAQLAHALNSRSETLSVFRLGLRSNPQLLGAIALSILAQFAAIYVPFLNRIFGTVPIFGGDFLIGMALAISPLVFGEIWKRRSSPATARASRAPTRTPGLRQRE